MNDKTQRQLVRQLKIINFWISFYGIIVIIVMLVMAFMVFKVVTFVGETNSRIDGVKSTISKELNAKQKLCNNEGSLSNLIKDRTDFCK